jgi:HPt (histidine-containing phosphotransfer) domain-containing protein
VELFQTGSTRSLSELRDTLVMNDFERAAMICHKLAASAANVGAMSFAAAVRLLEQACLARDPVSAGRLHHGLQASHPSLIAELLRLQLRESA